jgi:hypothetical protein
MISLVQYSTYWRAFTACFLRVSRPYPSGRLMKTSQFASKTYNGVEAAHALPSLHQKTNRPLKTLSHQRTQN